MGFACTGDGDGLTLRRNPSKPQARPISPAVHCSSNTRMLRRRPPLGHMETSTCRRSSRFPSQPHVPDPKALLPPPLAKKVPLTVSAHWRSWSDPYHWMRDTSDPDLAALLAAENAYPDAFVGSASARGCPLPPSHRLNLGGPGLYHAASPLLLAYSLKCIHVIRKL
jgi:hypothetical protein